MMNVTKTPATVTPETEVIAEIFNEGVKRGERLTFFMCDTGLQLSTIDELGDACEQIREAKLIAIANNAEQEANAFLGFEVLLRSVVWQLKMWVALKEGRHHDAWVALVEAQEHTLLGLRTPAGSPGVLGAARRLQALEVFLFPFLQFMSAGLTHEGGVCSICREAFSLCQHIEGRIYCGRVCSELELKNVTLDHGATVELPADKRCYVTEYSLEDGMWYDVMTRLPIRPVQPDEPKDVHRFGCVMLTAHVPPGVNP